jgi:type II secretory pathway component PulK
MRGLKGIVVLAVVVAVMSVLASDNLHSWKVGWKLSLCLPLGPGAR